MATPRCKKRVLELPCHLNCPQGLILQPAAAREGQSCQLLARSPFSYGGWRLFA